MWPHLVVSFAQRQRLTMIFCWIVIVFLLLEAAVVLGLAFAILFSTLGAAVAFGPLIAPALLILFVAHAVPLILWIWRRCDRCGYRLFSIRPVVLGNVVRDGSSRPPHYLARQLLGSFQWGVIRDAAMGRGARCLWCGHQDGVKPDYVIVSQQN